jgi:hypothetical protein
MALRAACGRCAHGTWSWRTRALQQSRLELAGKMISLPYRSLESKAFAFSDTALDLVSGTVRKMVIDFHCDLEFGLRIGGEIAPAERDLKRWCGVGNKSDSR